MKEYLKDNKALLFSIAGLFAVAATVLLAAVLFNDAGGAASVLM